MQPSLLAESLSLDTLPDDRLSRLLGYWRGKCQGWRLPRRADIDPLDFPWVLGRLGLIDVVDAPLGAPASYRVRLFGSTLAEDYGADYTGALIDTMSPTANAQMTWRQVEAVARQAQPVAERVRWGYDGRRGEELRLLLPLSEDGRRVTTVIYAAVADTSLRRVVRAAHHDGAAYMAPAYA